MTITESESANVPYNHVTSYTYAGFLTTSNSVPTYAQHTVTSTDITNFSSWSTVFDQYRILRAKVWIVPRVSQVSSTSANPGQLVTVIDYDDGNALSSFAAGLQYSNALVAPGLQGHYRDFAPHIAVGAYSGTFTSYANMDATTWIDAASTGVSFYGLKAASTVTDATYTYDINVRLHVQFRNSR
jgi:hypothetical protein